MTTDDPMIQAVPETGEPVEVSPADLPKYIEVRQHPPGKFSSYRHQWQDKAGGVIRSIGRWKKTGAEVVQKLLFQREKGWTEDTIKAWFDDHPEYRYPDATYGGVFFALAADDAADPIEDAFTLTAETLDACNAENGTVFDVIPIRGGWGKNQRRGPDGRLYRDYFTTDFLQSLLPLIEGTPVQAVKIRAKSAENLPADAPDIIKNTLADLRQHGHPEPLTNMLLTMGLTGNTIGFLKNCRYEVFAGQDVGSGDGLRAEFHLAETPDALAARQLFHTAWQQGLRRSLGLSINYKSNVIFTEHDGLPACQFLQATKHVSTEFVPNPGAGGVILGVLQGESSMNDDVKAPVQAQDTPQPDHEIPASDAPTTQAVKMSTADREVRQEPTVKSQTPPAEGTEDSLEAVQSLIHVAVETMKTEMAPLAAEVQAIKRADLQRELSLLVTQSTVSQPKKDKLLDSITSGTVKTREDVEFLLSLAQSEATPVYPSFLGLSGADVTRDPKDVMKLRSLQTWGLPLTQSEQDFVGKHRIAPFSGIKDEYIAYTKDTGLRNACDTAYMQSVMHPDMAWIPGLGDGYTQTVYNTTYPGFLTNIINRTLEAHYKKTDKSWERLVAKGSPYSDNRTHEEWILGQFPEIDAVAQGGTYTEVGYGNLQKLTNTSSKYGNIFKVTEETLQDDNLDYIKTSVQLFADAMNRTVMRKVMNNILAYSTAVNNATMTDSIAGTLYNNVLRGYNYVNGTILEFEKIRQLIEYMLTQRDYADDDGTQAPLVLMPWLFIGNITKIGYVRSFVRGEYEPGRTDQLPNTLHMTSIPVENFIGVHPSYLYDIAESGLFILPNPAEFAGQKISFFRGMETPEFVWEGNQQPAFGQAWASDVLQLRLKFKFRLGYQRLKAFYGLFQNL